MSSTPFGNLKKALIDYIFIDYITFTLLNKESFIKFLNQLIVIEENCRVYYVNNITEKVQRGGYVNNLDKTLLKSEDDSFTQKRLEIKSPYKVFYSHNRSRPSSRFTETVRIPGKLAHKVFLSVLKREIRLNPSDFDLSRLDVKLTFPSFLSKMAFNKAQSLLIDFVEQQTLFLGPYYNSMEKPIPVQKKVEKNHVCSYIYNRKNNPRMVRAYVSKGCPNTFELELKKKVVKAIGPFLFSQNYLGINKLLIQEISFCLDKIASTAFTKPLLLWKANSLDPIREAFWPNDKLKLTKNEFAEYSFLKEKSLPSLSKENFVVNAQLIPVIENQLTTLDQQEFDPYLISMVFSFCIKKLLEQWRFKYSPIIYYEKLSRCSLGHFVADCYQRDKETLISFKINDLLTFLNLSLDSVNRKKIKRLFDFLFSETVFFTLNGKEFQQHLIHSLEYSTLQGHSQTMALVLHPFVFYDLFAASLWYDETALVAYYQALALNSGGASKKPVFYKYSLFINMMLSASLHDFKPIEGLILQRDKKTLKSRVLFKKNFLDTLTILKKQRNLNFLVPQKILENLEDNQKFKKTKVDITLLSPPTLLFWSHVFEKTSDHLLKRTPISFESLSVEPKK